MKKNMIERYTASVEQQSACQSWELWESGDISEFSYDYDQDVEFIVQQGTAVIHSQFKDSVISFIFFSNKFCIFCLVKKRLIFVTD